MENSILEVKKRDSNLELYRIILMILIIAHHYVVNSDLINIILSNISNCKSIFLLIFGAWGKIGINCFILISGYFMCKSNIKIKKFIKLFLEVIFYNTIISTIFWLTGYETFSVTALIQNFMPIKTIGLDFVGSYLLFYLCIPFLNILTNNINEKQHIFLIMLVSFIYIYFGTFAKTAVTMNYISWFIVLYVISSYIRIYPKKIYTNKLVWGLLTLTFIFLSILSIIILSIQYPNIHISPYYFIMDTNTFLAVLVAVASFLFFKNLDIGYSKIINNISKSTFGILLIHANSDNMRKWLWKDVLNNVEMYKTDYYYLHAIFSVVSIFIICCLLDMIRIRLIEQPFFDLLHKLNKKLKIKFKT